MTLLENSLAPGTRCSPAPIVPAKARKRRLLNG